MALVLFAVCVNEQNQSLNSENVQKDVKFGQCLYLSAALCHDTQTCMHRTD